MIQRFFEWIKRFFMRRPQERDAANRAKTDADKYEDISSISFAAIFANKLANIVVADSQVDVAGDGRRAELIDAAVRGVWVKAHPITSQAFGKGGKVIVPYVDAGELRYSVIDQHRMAITQMRGDRVMGATLIADMLTKGIKKYYRLADYSMEDGIHRIVNRVVDDGGQPHSLIAFPEWADISEEIAIANVDRPLLAFLRCPVDNRLDRDAYGVPITYGSEAIIAEIIEHLAIIRREYKLTRPMLGLDSTLWRNRQSKARDKDGKPIRPFGQVIDDVHATAQDSEYPFIPVDSLDATQPWLLYSPAIRSTAMYDRLQELFALLERSVGTSRGILTERESTGATATEIRAAMYDTFCVVAAMRKNWERTLDDLAYSYDVLAEHYGLTPAGSRGMYTVVADWDYSLYESGAETFAQLSELQSRAMISKAELRQWVKGGTLDEAQAAIDAMAEQNPLAAILGGINADR